MREVAQGGLDPLIVRRNHAQARVAAEQQADLRQLREGARGIAIDQGAAGEEFLPWAFDAFESPTGVAAEEQPAPAVEGDEQTDRAGRMAGQGTSTRRPSPNRSRLSSKPMNGRGSKL